MTPDKINTSEARCTCGLLSDLCQCYRAGRIEVAQELDRYKKALAVAQAGTSGLVRACRNQIELILGGASPNEEQD